VIILTPADFSVGPASGPSAVLDWVSSVNGETVIDNGQSAASLLPRDDDVVLVLPLRVVSWHRMAVPKVSGARVRAVLDGLLEDRLLTDTADMHFALEPGGRAGQTVWIAACERIWLRGWLQALEAAGRPVTRIVPALWPLAPLDGAMPTLHWAHDEGNQVWLATASPLGVRCTPLEEGGHSGLGESAFGGLSTATGSIANELLWQAWPSARSTSASSSSPSPLGCCNVPSPTGTWRSSTSACRLARGADSGCARRCGGCAARPTGVPRAGASARWWRCSCWA
jgi:general secretion pathway protein L